MATWNRQSKQKTWKSSRRGKKLRGFWNSSYERLEETPKECPSANNIKQHCCWFYFVRKVVGLRWLLMFSKRRMIAVDCFWKVCLTKNTVCWLALFRLGSNGFSRAGRGEEAGWRKGIGRSMLRNWLMDLKKCLCLKMKALICFNY